MAQTCLSSDNFHSFYQKAALSAIQGLGMKVAVLTLNLTVLTVVISGEREPGGWTTKCAHKRLLN